MTVVVVDTNILCGSPWLRRRDLLSLLENRAAWGVVVVVPEVVFVETVNVVRRNWAEQHATLASFKAGVFGMKPQQQAMLDEITRRSEEYEQWLRDRLDEVGVSIVPTPEFSWREVASRAAERRAPYSEKKVDGLRDTLIWLAVMSVAAADADEKVWFVSDNHGDFGEPGKGNSVKEACPFPLHPHLVDDLEVKDLLGRVEYVVKLDRLVRHFESLFEPISAADLIRMTDGLDQTSLGPRLAAALTELEVDPMRAALPLNVVAAQVVGVQQPADKWLFSDGAGRGEAGWATRFSVVAELDIAAVDDGLASVEETKMLKVSGDILASPDGEIQDVIVTSVDALPDDPMRARWERRAERAAADSGSRERQRDVSSAATVKRMQAEALMSFKLAEQWRQPWAASQAKMTLDNLAALSGQADRAASVFGPLAEQMRRTQAAMNNPLAEQMRRTQAAMNNPLAEQMRRAQAAMNNPLAEQMRRAQAAMNNPLADEIRERQQRGVDMGQQVTESDDELQEDEEALDGAEEPTRSAKEDDVDEA